ncbi:choice-of-anchor I family protein [Paenibacillus filicis]|uniref:Choice-of-anchor I family protein n=1 Tax=Paenibacillus filicis TaxID=669464 RepID=A0ABU9DHU9_9BACL
MNKKRRTIVSLLLASELIASSLLAIVPVRAAESVNPGTPYTADGSYDVTVPHVFINQIYGGGLEADPDTPVSHGFIELYNPTEQDVPLNQWSLHYAYNDKKSSTNPQGTTTDWKSLNLTGTIKAHSSYLITGKPTGALTKNQKIDLTSKSDQTLDESIYNKAMKVALMSNQATLTLAQPFSPTSKPAGYIDLVGVADNDSESVIDGYEAAFPTGKTEGKSKKKGIVRKALTDTDNNKADFQQIDYSSADAATLLAKGPRGSIDGSWPLGALGISTDKLADAYEGSSYSVTAAAYGGKPPYRFQAEGLPTGLSIDAASGNVSGVPATGTAGSAAVTVVVYDSAQPEARASRSLTLAVKPPKPVLTPDTLNIQKIGQYQVGASNKDGGVAEIVKYNKDNGKLYVVSGSSVPPSLDIVPLTGGGTLSKEKSVLVKDLSERDGFIFGDLTSVDVNTATKRVAVAIQHADSMKNGKILLLDYDGALIQSYEAGVQPDMVKFTSDGRYILTADEAEPRLGNQDPEGSVTIVDTVKGESVQVKFDDPSVIDDAVHIRGTADPVSGLIKGSGTKSDAVRDLEPEYIALSSDESKAYVALQENNAIAIVDIAAKKVMAVKGLGYKDFNSAKNALDIVKDGQIKLENVPFYGMYMPDGIATHTIQGKTYLFTANEGDATDWPGYKNATKIGKLKAELNSESAAAQFLQGKTQYDELEVASDMSKDGVYLYGGRSFSIWNPDTMTQVYDSGSDFERITGERLPDYFNASNSKNEKDDRSTKKGPEPEYVAVGEVGSKVLAFVGLERIGGVMTYDVTNPSEPVFVNYLNTRDFTAGLNTDTGPEGLEFIPAADSPTGSPILLVANEVGGTIAVLELKTPKVQLDRKELTLRAGDASVKLTATADGGSEGLSWSSSNPAIAKVDNQGNVTPVASGKAVITVRTADGYGQAQANVTVSGPWKLTVMHTNDTHAHLADVARRTTLVKQVRQEAGNSLLLDAGDVFSGDLYFTKWKGQADLAFMNLMGYDAMTFGNHEFDQGTQTLADFISQAKFPLLSSNIDFSADSKISPLLRKPTVIDTQKPKSTANSGVYPYIVMDVNGKKVAVFGLTTEDTKETSSPGKDVLFNPAAESAAKTVQAIKGEGIQIIIALSHLGYNRDRELAAAVPGIDVIVGGHTHTKLDEPVVISGNPSEPTVIVQANEWGKYLGRLDVTFDEQGVVQTGQGQLQGKLITVDDKVAEDPEAKSMLQPYKAELELLKQQEIGKTTVLLDGVRENVRSKETNLGNFIADGMLIKAKALKNADIAIMNGGGIRDSIQQGVITMGALRTVMPFGNTLYVLDVTGKQLKEGLENGVSGAKSKDLPGKFPQIAGMTFKWDPAQPAGSKVFDVMIKQGEQFVPLQLNATYRLATNSFVANGGDGYASFADAVASGAYHEDLGYPDYENFIDYVNSLGGTISPAVQGRIIETSKPSTESGSDSDSDTGNTGNSSPAAPGESSGSKPSGNSESNTIQLPADALQIKESKNSEGQTVKSVTVNADSLRAALAQAVGGSGGGSVPSQVAINVPTSGGAAQVTLPGEVLAANGSSSNQTIISIRTETASYELPLHILNAAGTGLGGSSPSSVQVEITPAAGSLLQSLQQSVNGLNGATLVGNQAIDFQVKVTVNGQTKNLTDFGKAYVSRTIQLPSTGNWLNATGVMYDPKTGEFQFVPGDAKTVNGQPAFELKRPGNSVYAVLMHTKNFADLNGHWSQNDVEKMASKLIVRGVSDDRYAPDQTVTRAEFTVLVVRSLGLTASGDASAFKDVPAASWYAGAVGTAARLGLVEGKEAASFAPDAQITRAEMAVLITRAMQFAGVATSAAGKDGLTSFKDASSIPQWASTQAAWLADKGIMQGDSDARFAPADPATRAQAAVTLLRTLKKAGFVN